MARAAALIEPLLIGEPLSAEMSTSWRGQSKPFMLRCAILFTGDQQLFRCSAPVWPSAREVRGTVEVGVLVLASEGWDADEPWLAFVIGSELIESERVLAARAEVLWAHARTSNAKLSALIERLYPKTNQLDLMQIRQAASQSFHSRTEKLARKAFSEMRRRIWHEWSR